MRLAAVSVDLDEVHCYAAIHGLPPLTGESAHAVYRRALPRFGDLFDDLAVPATFFAVGADLREPGNAERLRALAADGHEIGNHTASHFYDLTRRGREEMRREVTEGAEAIRRACGVSPEGFRAPGYTVTDALFEVLAEEGVTYDASVFPCPPYYGAKALALGAIALRGRTSRSILDDPRVLSAPADPYRVGRPYWQRGAGMLELPIGVTRATTGRLPYIGTTVVGGGARGARLLSRMIAGRPLVSLELHGMDLADAERDGLGPLRAHQPDLRLGAEEKAAALRAAIGVLRGAGYRFVTLAEAARHFGGST